jgi:hypothetical protein
MPVIAISIFGVALVAIGALFVLKYWETGTGRLVAPALRTGADTYALQFKRRLFRARLDLARTVPFAVLFSRYLIHEGALAFAAFARISEMQAHRLADLVSHKRTFVPRETRSTFLRQVSGQQVVDVPELE